MFSLSGNPFMGQIPTQIGSLSKMISHFRLYETSVTGSIPTQLGQLTLMVQYLQLQNNDLCGDIPTEVTALESNMAYGWPVDSFEGSLTTGNNLGTDCHT